jgi:hypothetical protein
VEALARQLDVLQRTVETLSEAVLSGERGARIDRTTKVADSPGGGDPEDSSSTDEDGQRDRGSARAEGAKSSGSARGGKKHHPLDRAIKFFSIQLQGVQVSKAGDTAFPFARDTWHNCLRDYPVAEEDERALMSVCFKDDASREYQAISRKHVNATRPEIWLLLEELLWNEDHQAAARDEFYALKMKRGETPLDFAARIRRAGGAVKESSEELYKQIFRDGVPPRLKPMVAMVSSRSTLASLASGLQMSGIAGSGVFTDRENIAVVQEATPHPPTLGQTRNEEQMEYVRRMEEVGMAAGPAPGLPINPRFKDTQCFKCNRVGHTARYCRWEKVASAESGTAPADSDPKN